MIKRFEIITVFSQCASGAIRWEGGVTFFFTNSELRFTEISNLRRRFGCTSGSIKQTNTLTPAFIICIEIHRGYEDTCRMPFIIY